MIKRFNGRVGFKVLGINIYSHRALEQPSRVKEVVARIGSGEEALEA